MSNILYITQYFPPEIGATQSRAYEMAKNLIRLGHHVTVMTEVPNHPSGIIPDEYKHKFFVKEAYDGIPVIRSWVYATPVKSFSTRLVFYFSFMITTILNSFFIRNGTFDIVYATSPPLFVGWAGLVISKLRRIPFVFEVRDLWPESAIELNQLGNPLQIRLGYWIADMFYRHSKGIVAVTQGIYNALCLKGIPENTLQLIKNGTNPDRYRYSYDPSLEEALGWKGKFVVLYAGIHGVAQGLETVLEAAEYLKDFPSIHFAFIGEGPVKDSLISEKDRKGLCNVQFLNEVPSDRISKYISLAGICLVPLKNIAIFKGALPSKIFDSWACAKPILLSVDGEARCELESSGGGRYVEPENPHALAQAILDMYHHPERCRDMGKLGRAYLFKKGYIRSEQAKLLSQLIENISTLSQKNLEQGKKIKILRVISRLNIGGPSIHVQQLMDGLNSNKFDSILVAGTLSPKEGDMSYLFDSIPENPVILPELQREISPIKDMKTILKILGMIHKNKPDIIHTHTAKAGTITRTAAILYRLITGKSIKMVHTFHGHVFQDYFNKSVSNLFINIERFLALFCDAIVAISETQAQELSEIYEIAPREKIRLIPLGFDLTPFFNSNRLKGQFKKELNMASDVLLVGIVGRLAPIKNHRMFLKSVERLIRQKPNRQIRFLIIGDGQLRDSLEKYCSENMLSDHVRFCGWIKDISKVYADIDILAMTSLNEGTPVSIIEAMAASVPVIATEAGGIKDLLGKVIDDSTDGFTVCRRGILCRNDDVRGFTKGLDYLINMKEADKQRMIASAHSYVESHYANTRLFSDMERLYLSL